MSENIICPKCKHGQMVFRKSSFEQYEPSDYKCDNCGKTYTSAMSKQVWLQAQLIEANNKLALIAKVRASHRYSSILGLTIDQILNGTFVEDDTEEKEDKT